MASMRQSLRLICFLLMPLCLPCFSTAFAADGTVISAELLNSLISGNINDRYQAIGDLGADDSAGASLLLDALLKGDLLADKEQGRLYIQTKTPGECISVESGAAVNIADTTKLRKVSINNRQRADIVKIVNVRALRSPNVAIRRKASATLPGAADVDIRLVQELAQNEPDRLTHDNFLRVLAIHSLRDKDAKAEEQLAALNNLTSLYTPEAIQLITLSRSSSDALIAKTAEKALRQTEATSQHLALFETLFFGLSLGGVLVLIAIGLAITFGVMGVINMAYGEMVMLGAYTVWGLQQLLPGQAGLALLLAIPASFLVSGGVGALTEITIIRHLYGRPLETLLATFGVSLILQQAVRTVISPMNRAVETPAFMSGLWAVTEHFTIAYGRVYIIIFCLLVFAVVYLVMRKTTLGLEVRAVTQNRAIARAMGVNSSRVDIMTFSLGSGMAGMAGVALSQLTNVGPNLGQNYIVDSFLVVVLGGVGNLWGTMIGGLIIGIANKFLEPVNGAILAKIIIMVGIILFIQRYPSGLFPQKGRAAAV